MFPRLFSSPSTPAVVTKIKNFFVELDSSEETVIVLEPLDTRSPFTPLTFYFTGAYRSMFVYWFIIQVADIGHPL